MKRFSFSRILFLTGALALAITCQAKAAATTTGGPYIDFKGHLGTDTLIPGSPIVTQAIDWHTEFLGPPISWSVTVNPYNGPLPIIGSWQESVSDTAWVVKNDNWNNNPMSEYIVGTSYITYDPSSGTADMVFTTIYGIDPNHTDANSLAMTGYNMTASEVTVSNESVVGPDGVIYDASVHQFTQISNLHSLLGSDFDLTSIQGDPTAGVYVFQTTIPQSAFSRVPEPSTFALLGVGAMSLLAYAWRQKRPAA